MKNKTLTVLKYSTKTVEIEEKAITHKYINAKKVAGLN
jgi:hypothetical protein